MRSTQQPRLAVPTAPSRTPSQLNAPISYNPGMNDHISSSILPSTDSFGFEPRADIYSGLPAGAFRMNSAAVDGLNRNLAQERYEQLHLQREIHAETEFQRHQQQWASMNLRQNEQQVQDNLLAQRAQQQEQQQLSTSISRGRLRDCHQQLDTLGNHATPASLPTLQRTPEQLFDHPNTAFAPLMATHPQLQRSISSNFIDTVHDFTPKPRTPTAHRSQRTNTSSPSPRVDYVRCTPTPHLTEPASIAPHLHIRPGISLSAERARQNEIAKRARLDNERRKQQAACRARFKALSEPNAIYHSYKEVLELFPLRRGEHPNPYLIGLLANQPIPAVAVSDRRLAIMYAKAHWENYWELKDLDFVVEKAKEAMEGNTSPRRRLSGATTTTQPH